MALGPHQRPIAEPDSIKADKCDIFWAPCYDAVLYQVVRTGFLFGHTSPCDLDIAAATTLTIVVGVPQRPRLVRVKVRVPADAGAREVGVGQEAALAVEGRAVAVETRGEDDGDVHVLLCALQLTVGHGLEAQRRHVLPHVERSPYGVVRQLAAHLGRHVLYAARTSKEGAGLIQFNTIPFLLYRPQSKVQSQRA